MTFFIIYPSFLIQQEICLTYHSILSKIKDIVTFMRYLFNAQKQQYMYLLHNKVYFKLKRKEHMIISFTHNHAKQL